MARGVYLVILAGMLLTLYGVMSEENNDRDLDELEADEEGLQMQLRGWLANVGRCARIEEPCGTKQMRKCCESLHCNSRWNGICMDHACSFQGESCTFLKNSCCYPLRCVKSGKIMSRCQP